MAKTRKSARTGVSGNRELLTWALHGLEQEIATTRQRLQELEAQARQLRGGARSASASEAAPHLIARMPDHELWMAFLRDPEGNLFALMAEVR